MNSCQIGGPIPSPVDECQLWRLWNDPKLAIMKQIFIQGIIVKIGFANITRLADQMVNYMDQLLTGPLDKNRKDNIIYEQLRTYVQNTLYQDPEWQNRINKIKSRQSSTTSTSSTSSTSSVNLYKRSNRRVQELSSLVTPEILQPLQPLQSYLDVGCSEGKITADLGQYLGLPKDQIEGCDIISEANINEHLGVANTFNYTQLDLDNPYKLPYPDQSQSVVSAFMSLHHIAQPELTLQEIKRVLVPGGIFLVREHDNNPTELKLVLDLMHAFYILVWPAQKEEPTFKDHFAQYYTKSELINLVAQHGFKVQASTEPQTEWRYYYQIFVKPYANIEQVMLNDLAQTAQLSLPTAEFKDVFNAIIILKQRLATVDKSNLIKLTGEFMVGWYNYIIKLDSKSYSNTIQYFNLIINKFNIYSVIISNLQSSNDLITKTGNPNSVYQQPDTYLISINNTELQKQNTLLFNQILSYLHSLEYIGFPFKKTFLCCADQMVQNLRSFANDPFSNDRLNNQDLRPKNIKFNADSSVVNFNFDQNQHYNFVVKPDDYQRMDVVVDIFQEPVRIKCQRKDQVDGSPWQRWHDIKFNQQLVNKVLNKQQGLTPELLREQLYLEAKECTQFKPTVVIQVIKLFNASKMLDFSAGWGDRLIGAISANLQVYQAYDPNINLKPGHDQIIQRYASTEQKDNFKIYYEPFETATLADNYTYDLIFTSPPFFDFEKYSSLDTQSSARYANINKWLTNFLLASITNAWTKLEVNGHCVIHITDVYTTKVVEAMILLVLTNIPDAYYRGMITSVGDAGQPRPMWVFTKLDLNNLDLEQKQNFVQLSQIANTELNKLYPQLNTNINLNPEIVITTTNNGFKVVRDDYLVGGTKQRALKQYLELFPQYNEFIYVSPSNGYAQVALAYVASIIGVNATIFVAKQKPRSKLTQQAINFGANVIEYDQPNSMKDLRNYAQEYAKNKSKTMILAFGLDDDKYISLLAEAIKQSWPKSFEPKTFWLVAGSGTILRALHKIWPEAFYNVVQVGKPIYDDIVAGISHKIYVAPEKFWENVKQLPPYSSVSTYDAKLWQFVIKDGQPGDYIWNVAKDV